jgi:hypothetical protein
VVLNLCFDYEAMRLLGVENHVCELQLIVRGIHTVQVQTVIKGIFIPRFFSNQGIFAA